VKLGVVNVSKSISPTALANSLSSMVSLIVGVYEGNSTFSELAAVWIMLVGRTLAWMS
jgi:hypothetical protein